MSLPDGQLQILIAIENELQADPKLESAFSAFTSVTRDGGMPAAERLGPPDSLSLWGPSWPGSLTFADRLLIAIAAVTVVAGIVVPVIVLSRC